MFEVFRGFGEKEKGKENSMLHCCGLSWSLLENHDTVPFQSIGHTAVTVTKNSF